MWGRQFTHSQEQRNALEAGSSLSQFVSVKNILHAACTILNRIITITVPKKPTPLKYEDNF